MVQLLLCVLSAAIILAGVHGFAKGFTRNSGQTVREYSPRLVRQILVGLIAAVLIGLMIPSVWIVLVVSVVVSALIGWFIR